MSTLSACHPAILGYMSVFLASKALQQQLLAVIDAAILQRSVQDKSLADGDVGSSIIVEFNHQHARASLAHHRLPCPVGIKF
ncbi:hypothetical protein EYZ11_006245 [Aspergillus tanneri]|uniref:Uncharacterized protein n=1 Tax=Aspergillus tanneri TaxID=1220188 RepID=A0A4S3JGA0_9EURO|nr:hypothetical protein EYZ11_006245 [Aspergillus tanneri]